MTLATGPAACEPDTPFSDQTEPAAAPGYAVVPNSVLRDHRLSVNARLLYALMDGRQTSSRSLRVRNSTLAADMGVSESAVDRAMAELVAAGYVSRKRSGRTAVTAVDNPLRTDGRRRQEQDKPTLPESRRVTSGASDASPAVRLQRIISGGIHNNNQPTETPSEPARAAAAADHGVEDYLAAIHATAGVRLSMTKRNRQLVQRLAESGIGPAETGLLTAAWLAAQKAKTDVYYPPGFVVDIVLPALADGAGMPEPEQPTAVLPPVRELLAAERCDHGELSGRCALCRRVSQRQEMTAALESDPLEELLAAETRHNQTARTRSAG